MTEACCNDDSLSFNITIRRGVTFSLPMDWKDDAGDPRDLSQCTAVMQIRENLNSPVAFINLTTENGGIVLGDGEGEFNVIITITAEDTAAIPANIVAGVYTLLISFPPDEDDNVYVKDLLGGDAVIQVLATRG